MTPRSLQAQIAEARRELAVRRSVYRGMIARHKMKPGEADELINLQENIIASLERLALLEIKVKLPVEW